MQVSGKSPDQFIVFPLTIKHLPLTKLNLLAKALATMKRPDLTGPIIVTLGTNGTSDGFWHTI